MAAPRADWLKSRIEALAVVRSALSERLGRSPTERELSEELGISIEDVRVLTQASQSSLSLNEPVDEEGDSELGDLLEQTVLPDTDERYLSTDRYEAPAEPMDEPTTPEPDG